MSPTFACSQCGAKGTLPDEPIDDQRCPTCDALPVEVSLVSLPPRTILGMSVPAFAVVVTVLVLCAGVPLVLLPMIQRNRETVYRYTSKDQMRDLDTAFHLYADAHDYLPTEAAIYGDRKPLLSWRVHILQYVEGRHRYDQFHLDEPWDSPHNKKLILQMPAVYWSPTSKVTDEGKTVFLAVTGPGTAFQKGTEVHIVIPDGISSTIMLVEVSDERAVIWTKPED
jgi:hypothetical protein